MKYRDFKDKKLSQLAFGTMRLPVIDGREKNIDQPQLEKMVEHAMANGVNYYDTAWGYHMGMAELAIGKALSKYPRESFYLADKFPGYDLSCIDKVEQIFQAQLRKCQVEYFDFYMFHNVCELNIDEYLKPEYGIYDYLIRQKKEGRIKHLGFSAHGSCEVMRRFLEAYGDAMEFCQIQLNWFDWTFQDAENKVALLQEYDLPIMVMEPLRGGYLTKLADEHIAALKKLRPDETVPGWSFRFLQRFPQVVTVLSGMSDFAQLAENVRIFAEDKPLNAEENDTLLAIAGEMQKNQILTCTACRYCTAHCPKKLDIPRLLELYNEDLLNKGSWVPVFGLMAMDKEFHPDACIGCRSCEAVCPQQLNIADALADFADRVKHVSF